MENLAPNQREIKTETMQVPAILFSSKKNVPEKETLDLVEKLAESPEIFHHIAVLSDAHPKLNIINPTGSVVASENNIIPEVMDAAPNCGMRVILTDLTEQNLTPEKMNGLFQDLRSAIPSKKIIGARISFQKVLDIFRNGSSALKNTFNFRTANEIENTYKNGNFFPADNLPSEKDILQKLPKAIIRIGKCRLGLLGATNSHFLSLTRVASVENFELAEKLGLKQGQYVFFMHTGSSIVGRYAASLYTSRKIKNLLQKIILSMIKFTTNKVKLDNLETVFRAAGNYGFANRTLITHKLDQTLEKVFERQVKLGLLYDAPHVYFDREKHYGKDVYVHRNGANRAFGPQKMSGHLTFEKTGEPVLIAPFADGFGFIGVGTDENQGTFFSANHEIGKAKELGITPDQYENYAAGILKEMEENKIIKIVAKLETIKTLTY
ncbi:MAG: RtcB family protein [Parcubacteria group bacterium]